MKRHTLIVLLGSAWLALGLSAAEPAPVAPPRERLSFNAGWRFQHGEPGWFGAQLDYTVLKPWLLATSAPLQVALEPRPARPGANIGGDLPLVQAAFDDSKWRLLDLPHDWGVEGGFKQEYSGETGKLPWWGIAWYRKHFTLPADDAGRRLTLEIDGAMSRSAVWVNGQFAGGWAYGYTSYAVDLTPYVKPGADNIIAIRLDNPTESSRWYPGGGLYRNLWLVKTGPVHVAHWGVTVTTPRVAADSAVVSVQVLTDNEGVEEAPVEVGTELYALDEAGRRGAAATGPAVPVPARVPGDRQASTTQTFTVAQPQLWDTEHPHRYVAVTTLRQAGAVVDRLETPFGIRTVAFDADRGLLLNGRPVPLHGVCDHHDLGALGTAVNVRALERQLEILRSFGCNALRTSHNPPAPELLDLCDRMGFLVIDESYDCWTKGKKLNDYHVYFPDWHAADLRALVRRDRNHPSVILWSVGNEVREQKGDDGAEGWKIAAHLAAIVREEDRTRPVTCAFDHPASGYTGFQHAVDVFGYNYKIDEYARFRRANPTVPVFATESASALSSRGEYFFPVGDDKLDPAARANFQVSSYDLAAAEWASTPEAEWRAEDGAPGFLGEFVWSGFDYLGEPTPYDDDSTVPLNMSDPAARERMVKQLAEQGRIPVPSRSSYFGIVDLAGFPKDRYYLYQARWLPDRPLAHLLPHWTWPERVGQVTPVHCYTSGDEAELFLNGRSLGRKLRPAGAWRVRWDDVRYEPGELKVVAYRHGLKWAEDRVRTAGAPARLTAAADRAALRADGADLAFVAVAVEDAAGTLAPRADNRVRYTLTGPGDIVAVDNGDATSLEPFRATQGKAYNGRALVIIRTHAGQPGALTLRAESAGLAAATVALQSTATP
jgi:beta-galactosidase